MKLEQYELIELLRSNTEGFFVEEVNSITSCTHYKFKFNNCQWDIALRGSPEIELNFRSCDCAAFYLVKEAFSAFKSVAHSSSSYGKVSWYEFTFSSALEFFQIYLGANEN